ncbi:HMG1/2 box-containing protein [Tieghemostelium lacteum]|uniref:HMG1/2 box-containing protein n=1 Tax=Tieghemostelium lacteum TaxID=361077 RepID=A0A152A5V8_TIELA|nr:HMG1/2 box-containing protein [Tieghemostelium lacteum]|eukprot:KYR01612.1 HMG1/2 box-containing protein [Tieghemostelium lacteum]
MKEVSTIPEFKFSKDLVESFEKTETSDEDIEFEDNDQEGVSEDDQFDESSDDNNKKPIKLKKPPNAFLVFSNSRRPELIKSNPNSTMQFISTKLGQEWKELHPEEKEKFNKMAQKIKEESAI